jgi:signal transduction histidine kinase
MTSGSGRREPDPSPTSIVPPASRVAALALVPGLVFGAFALVAALGGAIGIGPVAPVDGEPRAAAIADWFAAELLEAERVVAERVGKPAARLHGPGAAGARRRLEGVIALAPDGGELEWTGRPALVPAALLDGDAPRWALRDDGVHLRLLVRVALDGDDDGGGAVGSFVLDSRLEALAFERLLPHRLREGVRLWFRFEPDGRDGRAGIPTAALRFPLQAPDGSRLGEGALEPVPTAPARDRLLALGRAWAAVAFVLVVLWVFLRGRGSARDGGGRELLAAWAALAAARAALSLADVPATLLPRSWGSASLYGSPAAAGLLASPVDLALTALTALLAALALRSWCRRDPARRRWAALAGGLVGLACLVGSVRSVARNCRIPLLDRPGLLDWGATTPITVGLVLTILAAAILLGCATARRPERSDRLPAAVACIALALLVSFGLDRLGERLARERLSADLAPQIRLQSSRRALALDDSLRQVSEYFLEFGDEHALDAPDGTLAYDFWVASELFQSGFKSSLAFYDAEARPVSHFGFDVPRLDEEIETDGDPAPEPRHEVFGLTSAVSRQLLHAERPLTHDDRLVGHVVGHVVEEPDNLPFLPWSQPYLAALGAGVPEDLGDDLWGGPEYVIYDPRGRVVLDTLTRPPAMSPAIADAAVAAGDGESAVRVRSGERTYSGIAFEQAGYVHLLLVPVRGWLARFAGAARLGIVALALLALMVLWPRLVRGGPQDLLASLRGSYYRKLLTAVLLASVLPLVGLALFLQGYVERRAAANVESNAIALVGAAGRALEDYAASLIDVGESDPILINDDVLYWLRRVVGQEIHVYNGGVLLASSKRELFASGLLTPRLDGGVQRALIERGRPFVVASGAVGRRQIPVAYAQVFEHDPASTLVVAVPLFFAGQQIARDAQRVAEMLLLSTVLLVGLLAVAASALARTVARPLRELVDASGRIAEGDYATRLTPRTTDEVALLVRGFNHMATSLGAQRADLERRKEYVETLLRHATTGVISTDPAGRLVTLNPAARKLLGAAGARLDAGVPLAEALARSDELRPLADHLRDLAAGSAAGEPAIRAGEGEEIDLGGDGPQRRLRLARVELPDPGAGDGASVGALILLDDVTELMRSNQLSAWAEMARAIAHEIKNPLTPIQLSTEHLARLLRDRGVLPSPEIEACIRTVIKQVRSLYEIAGAFSAYAKLPQLDPRPADPAEFMRETVEPYRVASPPGVEIEERYEDCAQVAIDAKVLARAVINLVENALHAMPDGGALRFAALRHGDDHVALVVEDSGEGLSPEARRRLFEPYFSTKTAGTGLGLAIVRRVVEAHQGRVEVEGAPGGGTTFRIVLPRSA